MNNTKEVKKTNTVGEKVIVKTWSIQDIKKHLIVLYKKQTTTSNPKIIKSIIDDWELELAKKQKQVNNG